MYKYIQLMGDWGGVLEQGGKLAQHMLTRAPARTAEHGRNVVELSRRKGTGAFLERTGTRPLPVCRTPTRVTALVSMCCICGCRLKGGSGVGGGGVEAFTSQPNQVCRKVTHSGKTENQGENRRRVDPGLHHALLRGQFPGPGSTSARVRGCGGAQRPADSEMMVGFCCTHTLTPQ